MSLHTILYNNPNTQTAILSDRGQTISANNGGGVQENNIILASGIIGALGFVSGNQNDYAASLEQEATHLFLTDYIFATSPANGNILTIGSTKYSILSWQQLTHGYNAMSEFYLEEIKI